MGAGELGLDCPRCGARMEKVTRGSVSFRRCACGGTYIAIGSLRRMMPEGSWGRVWPRIREAQRAGARVCPGCRHSMSVSDALAAFGGWPIDVCERCEMVFLDPDEYESVAKRDVPPELPLERRQKIGRAMALAIGADYDLNWKTVSAPFEAIAHAFLRAGTRRWP